MVSAEIFVSSVSIDSCDMKLRPADPKSLLPSFQCALSHEEQGKSISFFRLRTLVISRYFMRPSALFQLDELADHSALARCKASGRFLVTSKTGG